MVTRVKASRVGLVFLLLLLPGLSGCLSFDQGANEGFTLAGFSKDLGKGRGVTIGILDTGIDVAHSSLDHLVDGNRDNGELLGYMDALTGAQGISFADDKDGHGTHVSAIIAGRGSSFKDKLLYGGIELQGAAPEASLYVVRVCGDEGCPQQAIADGLRWLRGIGVDVVSMSLGGARGVDLVIGDAVRAEIGALISNGSVVLAAAGNDGAEASDVNAPADIAGVIAVGAVDLNGNHAPFSNKGDATANQCFAGGFFPGGRCSPNQKPEIVAPGVGILSAWVDGEYARADGTSQATPFVTAAVALMIEAGGAPTNAEGVQNLKRALAASAQPHSTQETPHDDAYGYGLLNAARAVQAWAS